MDIVLNDFKIMLKKYFQKRLPSIETHNGKRV